MSQFNNRQNACYQTTCGKELWHSRNVAVCVMVLRPKPDDDTKIQVLAGKRGKAVTDSGLWCMPCGYLDWDETAEEAARREVFEETNLLIELDSLEMQQVDSRPEKARQNVTIHFASFQFEAVEQDLTPKDFDEVEEIRWITVGEEAELSWAFDHKERIGNLIRNGS